MGNELSGRSAIVTGAGHGAGLAIARRLVRAGASVMMADADEARLGAEVAALAGGGHDGRAAAFFGDLREKLGMTNLMAATMEAHDGIDILVNANHLVATSDPLSPETDQFEAMLARNVTATLRLSQIAARRMIALAEEDEAGAPADRAILNVSSIFARQAPPMLFAYAVSCAAIEQMSRSLALALAPHRVRVNALAVGKVGVRGAGAGAEAAEAALGGDVPPLGRAGEPRDAAEAALFLVSPAAAFVTGQTLAVDGGRMLSAPIFATDEG